MQVLLDTNVVSELRKARAGRADPRVVAWADARHADDLFLSVVALMEIEAGILRAERRDPAQGSVLRDWLERAVLPAFAGRVLPVTDAIARQAAAYSVPDPRPVADMLVAATAKVYGLALATRNERDFAGLGIDLINPWR